MPGRPARREVPLAIRVKSLSLVLAVSFRMSQRQGIGNDCSGSVGLRLHRKRSKIGSCRPRVEGGAMNRRIRQLIGRRRVVKAAEGTSVSEAARLMKEAGVGAILVVRKDRLVGIFTERDAIVRVLAEGRDPAHTRLSQVMTASPLALSPDKPFGHA